MLCYPAGQIKPYAGTGMSVTRWTERIEFISVQSVHPCDRKPEFLFASGALRDLSLRRRTGTARVAQLLFPLLGLSKEGDPPVSEERRTLTTAEALHLRGSGF